MATNQDLINAIDQLRDAIQTGTQSSNNNQSQTTDTTTGLLFKLEALNRVTTALNQRIEKFLPAQQQLIRSNTILANATNLSYKQLQSLDGGFSTATENIARLVDSGLDPNNEALLNLAGRTAILGQDINGLVKTNENLLGNGIISQKNMTVLNKSILDTSIKQGISIDRLIDSIDSLSQDLNFAVLGEQSFKAATGIVQEAAKILPKATLGNVEALVSKVFDPNNFEKLAALGLQDIAGGQVDPAIALQRLIAQGEEFARITQNQGLDVAKAIYGVYGQDFVQLLESLSNAEKLNPQEILLKQQEDAFKNSIDNLKAKLFGPLDQMAVGTLNVLTKFTEFLASNQFIINTLQGISNFIQENANVIGAALVGITTLLTTAAIIATLTFVKVAIMANALTLGFASVAAAAAGIAAYNMIQAEASKQIAANTKKQADIASEQAKQDELARTRNIAEKSAFSQFAERFMEANITEMSLINRRSNSQTREIESLLRQIRDDQRTNGSDNRYRGVVDALRGVE